MWKYSFSFLSFFPVFIQKKKECATGSYKADIGNGPCTSCPDHSETTSEGSTSCLCSMGYFKDSDSGSCKGILFSSFSSNFTLITKKKRMWNGNL